MDKDTDLLPLDLAEMLTGREARVGTIAGNAVQLVETRDGYLIVTDWFTSTIERLAFDVFLHAAENNLSVPVMGRAIIDAGKVIDAARNQIAYWKEPENEWDE